jgi:transposase
MKLHCSARTCPHCRSLIVRRVLVQGPRPSSVAVEFDVSAHTVFKWVSRYRALGLAGLGDRSSAPHHRPTRQIQPGRELHEATMAILHSPPTEHGFNRTAWRMRDLRLALAGVGVRTTMSSLSEVFHRAGYRWKKARVALTSTDSQYRVKLEAIKTRLNALTPDEAAFSIDEFGPVAVKMRGGKSLQAPGAVRSVPQWQKTRGSFILTAALELTTNQVTYFFSDRKNSEETMRLVDLIRKRYTQYRCLYLLWDAASWHRSKKLGSGLHSLNALASAGKGPRVEVLPLPSSAQFLNVIESVFSGLARAVVHNSNYSGIEEAQKAISRYLEERNRAFQENPRRAGRTIWGRERVPSAFADVNNCKDPRYR